MTDLIRHPENKILESTWIGLKASRLARPSPMDVRFFRLPAALWVGSNPLHVILRERLTAKKVEA
jgi:hypothetical protein